MNETTYVLCEDCGDDVARVETPSGAFVCAECSAKYWGVRDERTEWLRGMLGKYGHCGQ